MSFTVSREGPGGKLRRAKTHLAEARREIAALRSQDTHTVSFEDDRETSSYVFRVHGLKRPKSDLSLIIGDCLNNARAALDHLVYQLAILGQGRELSEKESKGCQFPICDTPDRFNGESGRITLLRKGERTRIEELQLFNAWDASIWGVTEFVPFARIKPTGPGPLLSRLRDLNDIDKHRRVHATWRGGQFDAPAPPLPFTESTRMMGALEDDEEIGRWHYPEPRLDLPPDFDPNSYFPVGISMGEPGLSEADETLTWITEAVEFVLSVFIPCLDCGDPPVHLAHAGYY